jgi:DNA-binding beta-propeller fold protein YncE
MHLLARIAPLAFVLACSSETPSGSGLDATVPSVADGGIDATARDASVLDASDARATCHNVPVAANARRAVVVSHPFGTDSGHSGRHELLVLEPSGTLTRPGTTFDLGAKSSSSVTFTPDGALGFVALADGAIGAFSIAPDFTVKVINPHFSGSFYAGNLAVSPHGHSLVVVDPNTPENGGGLYRLAIDCDGTLHEEAKIASVSGAFAVGVFSTAPWMLFVPGRSLADAGVNDDLSLFEVTETAAIRRGGATAFAGSDDIVSAVASTEDGAYVMVADDSIVAGNRVAVVDTKTFTTVKQLSAEFPSAIVPSPYNNAALIVSSDTVSKLRTVRYDSTKSGGNFTLAGEVAYTLGKPTLPQRAVGLRRGSLRGRVLVTELSAVRQLQFGADGSLDDVSITSFGSGLQNIVGSLGIVP